LLVATEVITHLAFYTGWPNAPLLPGDSTMEKGASMIQLTIKGKRVQYDGDLETPFLWYLRDGIELTAQSSAAAPDSAARARYTSMESNAELSDADERSRRETHHDQ
jgi:hypothetical protein